MPLIAPWNNVCAQGDLFFGYAQQRNDFLASKFPTLTNEQRRQVGYIVNDYDIGDATVVMPTPNDNNAYINAMRTHPKASFRGAVGVQAPMGQPETNSIWRIKSKGGLYYATQVAAKNVHFVLDGIIDPGDNNYTVAKMHDICEKTDAKDNPQGKAPVNQPVGPHGISTKTRTITHAELRWLYRNRADGNVDRLVQFWLANNPCAPPWDPSHGHQNIWTAYRA